MSNEDNAELMRRLRSEDPEERRLAVVSLPGAWAPGVLEHLIAALGDEDWRVRKECVAHLSRWPDVDGAVLALLTLVRDAEDVGARNGALDALAQIGKPAVAPILSDVGDSAAGSSEPSAGHHKFLVDALGAIGEREAAPLLVRLLDKDEPNLQVAAAEALRNIGGAEARSALRSCLGAHHLPLRLAALEGLCLLQVTVPAAELKDSLADAVLRKAALRLLGWSRDIEALPAIVSALADPRRVLHGAATAALANLLRAGESSAPESTKSAALLTAARSAATSLDNEARAHVVAVFASSDRDLRRGAVEVLGASGAVEFAASLASGISDPSVAEACATALIGIGAGAVAPVLDVAAEADLELRADLLELLGSLCEGKAGEGAAASALVEALDDDEFVAASAARALGAVGVGASQTLALAEALVDAERCEVACAAATALGQRALRNDDRAAALVLVEGGLASVLGEVRAASALAVVLVPQGMIDDRVGKIAPQLTDDDVYARLAAIRALASLGTEARLLLEQRASSETDAELVAAIRDVLGDTVRDAKVDGIRADDVDLGEPAGD